MVFELDGTFRINRMKFPFLHFFQLNQPMKSKKTWFYFVLFLPILGFLNSCNDSNDAPSFTRGMYYWRSDYLKKEEEELLVKFGVKKFYVKLFEVTYSETMGNVPIAKNRSICKDVKKNQAIELVPTVFIKNEIFKFNDEKSLDKLADNLVYLINRIYNAGDDTHAKAYTEIQLDCDWTKSTREKYFYLLKKVKELSGKKLSCTLRLYPYKYQTDMGIPPVDRVTLMCYNLIQPLSNKAKNSIFELSELRKYLSVKNTYPLPLDIVLPSFYWTQWYQNNKLARLCTLTSKEISSFAKPIKPLWYSVQKDTFLEPDFYFRSGDELKCEAVPSDSLNEAIKLLKQTIQFDKETTISLFDLKKNITIQYSDEEINSFYSGFSN